MLRLPHGIGPLFSQWLDRHYPLKKDKILSRVQELRGGKINDRRFGTRMHGEGAIAEAVQQIFEITRKKLAFPGKPRVTTASFRRPDDTPTLLFGDD